MTRKESVRHLLALQGEGALTRKDLLRHLADLGISKAIADKAASVDGTPAILLRWNGAMAFYTGFDADDPASEYEEWLIRVFGDR